MKATGMKGLSPAMTRVAARLVAQGMSRSEASAKAALYERCANVLAREGDGAAARAAFFVPGRIELLGKHTDYAGGRSLLCAVERGFVILAAPRQDADVRITDASSGETRVLRLDGDLEVARGDWSSYVATVARRVARNFPESGRGADIAFASDLPAASGMSSSSALIISIFLVLAAVNDLSNDARYVADIGTREALAGYLAAIENGQSFGALAGDHGVGTLGGSEDHTAVLCCRAGFLSQYAFCPVRFERSVAFPPGFALVVACSGVAAEKTGGAQASYNQAARAVRRILSIWNEATGSADASLWDAIASERGAPDRIRQVLAASSPRDISPLRLVDRFDQFVLESFDIIPRAAGAIANLELALLGELVDRSQRAAETQLCNQIPETIALARLARNAGAHAASAFGAGFGGSVWALVAERDADRFARAWRDGYQRACPAAAGRAEFIVTRPGPAAMSL